MNLARKLLVPSLLCVLCLIYFHDILTSRFLFTERDLSVFFLPPRACWVDMIKGFQLPLESLFLLWAAFLPLFSQVFFIL